ncbi:MAG TPA: hypothetical protein VGN42_14430 [Pirellulales bacterium]|jgi:DNA-directed RNA polymerase beta subunit|nr:hypothetical protein [Pirellulales bacterium]
MSNLTTFTIKCVQELDETGSFEEFTSDLYDIVDVDELTHLSGEGLPSIGTRVAPGLLLIGKIGQKKSEGTEKLNELQLLTANQCELREYWRKLLYDASVYVPDGCWGSVVAAYFESAGDRKQAVVEIERDSDHAGETSSWEAGAG